MGFEKVYITKQGALLSAKTLQGKKLEFDHAEIGSGNLSGNAVDKTALTTKVLECPIQKIEVTQETQTKVSFVFKNTDASNAFYFREIGLFAIDPDTKAKVLYAYTNAGTTAEYINNSIAEKIEKHITINVIVDNASNVTITLDSSEIYVTEKDLENALQNAKFYSGKTYGIKRLITDNTLPTWTRIADAEGLTANATKNGTKVANDFDDLYPWSHIQRCNVDPTTRKILAYHGETGYKTDGSNGEVMVKIPEFWWKRERIPDEFGNVYEYIYVADYARAGYKKSEEFFVGAYLLSTEEIEESTVVAHSWSGAIPRYNTTKANFRTYAQALGSGWQLMDYHYFLLQILYLVEYAHYNSQSMLGNGVITYSSSGGKALIAENSVNRIIISAVGNGFWVGKTVCIGTGTYSSSVAADREITSIEDFSDGSVTGKAIYFSGEPVDIAVDNVIWGSAQKNGENDELGNASGCINNNNYHAVNYRGIENIYGNLWQHIDGLNIKDYIAYICNDPASYENDKFDAPYEKIGYVNAKTSDSYIKKFGYDEKYPEVALPIEVGSSSTTGACDNYWCAEGSRIVFVGCYFLNSGLKAGFFAWDCNNASTYSGWSAGARLLMLQ